MPVMTRATALTRGPTTEYSTVSRGRTAEPPKDQVSTNLLRSMGFSWMKIMSGTARASPAASDSSPSRIPS